MLVLFSLLAAIGFAQCDVDANANTSQKRRQCKALAGCKWSSAFEQGGQLIPGECAATTSCSSLSQNQCKKRNNCYINWTANGRPCEDYDPNDAGITCSQLSGKKNSQKCDDRPNCIKGSGDRQNKVCLDVPANLQDRDCDEFDGKPNKYLCQTMDKCTWNGGQKTCSVKRKPAVVGCSTIGDRAECNAAPGGCQWGGGVCSQLQCDALDTRFKCNMSQRGCTWFSGFHATDFDANRNKQDQKDEGRDTLGAREGTCRAGVSECSDIAVRGHCLLAQQKYGLSGCHWNEEAQEMGEPRCSDHVPCSTHTNDGNAICQSNNNMDGDRCVWQLSGSTMRCMEFACDADRVNSKNKCNTVGCHWHRNKDKRDPNSQGFCGVLDFSRGR